jgi:hypothetical protein
MDKKALWLLASRPMDALTLFGLAAVTALLVLCALEDRSLGCSLACGGACALGSSRSTDGVRMRGA